MRLKRVRNIKTVHGTNTKFGTKSVTKNFHSDFVGWAFAALGPRLNMISSSKMEIVLYIPRPSSTCIS